MTAKRSDQITPAARLADALDRIARFGEAYEAATERLGHDGKDAGPALVVALTRYARRVHDENAV